MTKKRRKEDLQAIGYLVGFLMAYMMINGLGLIICMILYYLFLCAKNYIF